LTVVDPKILSFELTCGYAPERAFIAKLVFVKLIQIFPAQYLF